MITTESLLTLPDGFDLSTASPVQRARCRIGDGLPLEELRTDPEVVKMVGGPEALEALPSEQGIAPDMVVDASSIRSAKTMISVCRGGGAVFKVDPSGLKIGEVARIPIFSLKLSRARVAFRLLKALFARPALAPLVEDVTAESLMVRSPSGKLIEICCVAGGRAAADFVGDWLAGIIADEAPRMLGKDEGVTNLADVLTTIQGRMLPGAQVQLIGSPWAPRGPVYDLVTEHFGKPSARVVVMRSTGPQNNPAHFTPELCAGMQEADPVAYATSVMAEFADPESSIFSHLALRRNTREGQLQLVPEEGAIYAAAIDPSSGTASGNPFTLVIVEAYESEDDDMPFFRVASHLEWQGENLEAIYREVAAECRRYGLTDARTDEYAGSHAVTIAKKSANLDLHIVPWGNTKLDLFTNLATLIHSDRVELPPDPIFRTDLQNVKKRLTPAGAKIHQPTTHGNRHCDYASALCAAVHQAATANEWSHQDLRLCAAGDGRSIGGLRAGETWTSGEGPRMQFLTDGTAIMHYDD